MPAQTPPRTPEQPPVASQQSPRQERPHPTPTNTSAFFAAREQVPSQSAASNQPCRARAGRRACRDRRVRRRHLSEDVVRVADRRSHRARQQHRSRLEDGVGPGLVGGRRRGGSTRRAAHRTRAAGARARCATGSRCGGQHCPNGATATTATTDGHRNGDADATGDAGPDRACRTATRTWCAAASATTSAASTPVAGTPGKAGRRTTE